MGICDPELKIELLVGWVMTNWPMGSNVLIKVGEDVTLVPSEEMARASKAWSPLGTLVHTMECFAGVPACGTTCAVITDSPSLVLPLKNSTRVG